MLCIHPPEGDIRGFSLVEIKLQPESIPADDLLFYQGVHEVGVRVP